MNKLLMGCGLLILTLTVGLIALGPKVQVVYDLDVHPIDNMPLVGDDPFAAVAHGGAPIEKRDAEYRHWLAAGLKIKVRGASGSGTIIYYDPQDSYAYVQSCGHLWSGNMSAEEGKRRNVTCVVETWYHNDIKLDQPKEYPAEVLYYSNSRGRDISLLRFKADWEAGYFPIAPENFVFAEGMRLNSVGCDGGREVAHYDVRYIGMREASAGWQDLVTTENSPRPGRSGGGLMTDNFYVAICWGTSSYSGDGNGFFTPLSTIRQYNKQNGYGWLNEVNISWARMIPVKDRNNPQGEYPLDYIPLPRRR